MAVSGLVIPATYAVGLRWLYLALVGPAIILPTLLEKIDDSLSRKKALRLLCVILFLFYILVFSLLTIRRNSQWGDYQTFYNQIISVDPENYRVHLQFGFELGKNQKYQEAIQELLIASKFAGNSPNLATIYYNLGILYMKVNNTQLGIDFLTKSSDMNFIPAKKALMLIYAERK